MKTNRLLLRTLLAAAVLAPALAAPAAPAKAASTKAASAKAAWVPPSKLVTARSIGPARLGMSVAALKRAFPGSAVELEEGPVQYYSLKKNGREVICFATSDMERPLRPSDRASSLWTSDPRFRLASGVGPGTLLKDAARLHGRPTLSFWSHGEEAGFARLGKKMIFHVSAPPDPRSEYKVAGVYTRSQLESLNGTTRRFRAGTRIVAVGCSE